MSRQEYMEQLSYLLQDLAEEEKEEALQYYNDYFDDAGTKEESKIIEELGSPEKVAAIIKDGLLFNGKDKGEFSEKGYEDERFSNKQELNPHPEKVNAGSNGDGKDSTYENVEKLYEKYQRSGSDHQEEREYAHGKAQGMNSGTKLILIIIAALFFIPVGIPLIFSAIAACIGVIGVFIAFAIAGICFVVGGICLCVIGFAQLFSTAAVGLLFGGLGLVFFAVGTLMLLAVFWATVKGIPAVLSGCSWLWARIFGGKRGSAV